MLNDRSIATRVLATARSRQDNVEIVLGHHGMTKHHADAAILPDLSRCLIEHDVEICVPISVGSRGKGKIEAHFPIAVIQAPQPCILPGLTCEAPGKVHSSSHGLALHLVPLKGDQTGPGLASVIIQDELSVIVTLLGERQCSRTIWQTNNRRS